MKIGASLLLTTLVLAFPSVVLALGQESFGNTPVANQPEWVKGVLDVVNQESRVYSMWVNGNENFFYRGNAQALNEALKKYRAVETGGARRLILLPGTG